MGEYDPFVVRDHHERKIQNCHENLSVQVNEYSIIPILINIGEGAIL